jgi:hypothetical protein
MVINMRRTSGWLMIATFGPPRYADVGALDAIARVVARALIRALASGNAFEADAETRGVHHDEHVLEATILFADQVADGAAMVAESHDRRRAGVNAQLVLDRHAIGIVALAKAAVVVDHELRYDEQRNALDPFGAVGVRASTRWMMFSAMS